MANKTFYYMEIRVPGVEGDVIAAQRDYLDAHIIETDSKNSKIAKEMVFSRVTPHNKVGDTQAITIEFINTRNYETYKQVIAEFRAWVSANHNVEYVHEVYHDFAFDAIN